MSETDVDLDIAISQCQARSLWQTLTGNPSAELNEQTRSRVLGLLLELRDRRAASVGPEVREAWGVREAQLHEEAAKHHQYRPAAWDEYDCCGECNRQSGGYVRWPCSLVAALDGAL